MDGRYLLAALVLVAAAAVWQAMENTHSSFVWSLPFAVILLFLALIGDPPSRQALHYFPDPPVGEAARS